MPFLKLLCFTFPIAVLTGAVRRSGRRSLNDRCAVSGQAPGSSKRSAQAPPRGHCSMPLIMVSSNYRIAGRYLPPDKVKEERKIP